jgi:hypothetical protein
LAARSPAMNAGETSIVEKPTARESGGGSGRGAEDQAPAGAWSSEGLSAESISSRLAQKVNSVQAEAAKLKSLLDCGASCVLPCVIRGGGYMCHKRGRIHVVVYCHALSLSLLGRWHFPLQFSFWSPRSVS